MRGVALFVASRRGYNGTVIMSVSFNNFLLYKNFSALSTLATVSQAGFRTSRGFSCDNSCVDMSALGVTNKSANVTVFVVFVVVGVCDNRNFFLRNKNCVTYGTMLSFCETCLGAGRINSLIDNFGMTVSFDNFLCNENGITYGAMFTLGKTCFCTSRRYSLVYNLGMSVSHDNFLLYKDLSALSTLATVSQAGFRTSRSFS